MFDRGASAFPYQTKDSKEGQIPLGPYSEFLPLTSVSPPVPPYQVYLFVNLLVHVAIAVPIGLLLQPIVEFSLQELVLFVAAGILIDIDHLFYALATFRPLTLKNWVNRSLYMRKKMIPGFYIFHAPEFIILLLLWSLFTRSSVAVVLGVILHVSLDVLEHWNYHKNFAFMSVWSYLAKILR